MVSHYKKLTWSQLPRTTVVVKRRRDIWLVQYLSVYTHGVTGSLDGVARYANDTFDKVFGCIQWVVKDDHIPTLRVVKEIGYLIHQHIFIRVQARLHTRAIHSKTLSGKADYQEDQQGKGNSLDQFPDQTSSFL